MSDSILTSIKDSLGVTEDTFDSEIIMHINSVFVTLNQLGLGPDGGFMIQDDTLEWTDFLGNDPRYNLAKSYTQQSVKLLFDPPTIGYVLTSMEKNKEQMEWRLNVVREELVHPPTVEVDTEEDDILVIDGGSP